MTRGRLAAAFAAILAILLIGLLGSPGGAPTGQASGSTDPIRGARGAVGAPGAPGAMRHDGGAVDTDRLPAARPRATPTRDRALARAYAALGAADDGDRVALDALDDEARGRLDDARLLLDVGARAASTASATDGSATRSGPTGPAPDGASGAAGAMRLDLGRAVDARRALRTGDEGPELLERGVWAKSSFRPDRVRRLVITDRTGGGYAIRLHGADFATVRLDGGLIVPGRFYAVAGEAVITGEAACTVDIRPIEAVPTTHVPIRPPQGNG